MSAACLEKLKVYELYDVIPIIEKIRTYGLEQMIESNKDSAFKELFQMLESVFERKTHLRDYDKIR